MGRPGDQRPLGPGQGPPAWTMELPLQVVLVCPGAVLVLLGQDISASGLACHRKPEVSQAPLGRALHDGGGPTCLYPVSVGAFMLSLKYIKPLNIYLIYLRYRRVPTQNPQFVLLRTCKVYPRVLDKRYSFKVCHDTKKLLSMESVVYVSANHDLDFTKSLLMAETGVTLSASSEGQGAFFMPEFPGNLRHKLSKSASHSPKCRRRPEEGLLLGESQVVCGPTNQCPWTLYEHGLVPLPRGAREMSLYLVADCSHWGM